MRNQNPETLTDFPTLEMRDSPPETNKMRKVTETLIDLGILEMKDSPTDQATTTNHYNLLPIPIMMIDSQIEEMKMIIDSHPMIILTNSLRCKNMNPQNQQSAVTATRKSVEMLSKHWDNYFTLNASHAKNAARKLVLKNSMSKITKHIANIATNLPSCQNALVAEKKLRENT